MPRLIRIRTGALMEVLGSLERCSPDPRRNTSKDFFEASPSGNKEETRFHFISTSEGFCVEVEIKRKYISTSEPIIFL
jgi:hypothetical protein